MFDVIHLEISNKCQLSCPYCYTDRRAAHPPDFWLDLIKRLAPDTRQFTLGGGEPLLYDEPGVIIDAIHETGRKVSLTTNGLWHRRDVFSRLDMVSVSFHGNLITVTGTLALLKQLKVSRAVNFIALDQYKPFFGRVVEDCRRFDAALVILAPKFCGQHDVRWFIMHALEVKDQINTGLDGLCLNRCYAGEKFYTIASDGTPMQCSFVREPWLPGSPVRKFGCRRAHQVQQQL